MKQNANHYYNKLKATGIVALSIVAFFLVNIGGAAAGVFTLIVETSAMLMYGYAIKKSYPQNA